MTRQIEKMMEFFSDNPELFARVLEELDGWNGFLDGDRWEPMEFFDEFNSGRDPLDIARDVFNARGDFNPNDEVFRVNCYGLQSSDTYDYSEYLSESTMEEIIENRQHIYCIDDYDELRALFTGGAVEDYCENENER